MRTVIWPRRLVISSGRGAGRAAMTGHDDDFDSQTRTPITHRLLSAADVRLAKLTVH